MLLLLPLPITLAGHHNIFGKIVIEGADIDDDVVVGIDDAATAIGSDC